MKLEMINSSTNKIENWKLIAQQKKNFRVCFEVNDFNPLELLSNNSWGLCILSNGYQTSFIKDINFNDLSIITNSNSKYYLGVPTDEKYITILKQFLNKE
jgi:hypothetical protein